MKLKQVRDSRFPGVVFGLMMLLILPASMRAEWKYSEWFGHYYEDAAGWKYHLQHGWIHGQQTIEEQVMYYDFGLETWCFATAPSYPFIFIFRDPENGQSGWMWFEQGTVDPRWFCRAGDAQWFHEYAWRIFAIREVDTLPSPISQTAPIYPPELRDQGIDGEVMLVMTIEVDGTVSSIHIEESTHELFSAACREAVMQWLFVPAANNGFVVRCRARIRIPFTVRW